MARMRALILLACLGVCHVAAMPTADTLVVSKLEETSSTLDVSVEGPTTEAPLKPIKMLEMSVRSDVALRYARTAIVTRVRNPDHRAQETTFRVLLPETAFISGFVMILNGTSYKAYVKEKEEAKQIYNQAVSQGIGAAHIATKARDSNHFTVSVNVEPNTEAVFNLTYEELLLRRNGIYNHAINLHPGHVVPKLEVKVYIKESQKITTLRVPEIKYGNEVDASEDDKQNPIAKVDRGHDDREATITFTPDKDEQERLMAAYTTQYWSDSKNNNEEKVGVLGQFVVQYDVDRPVEGEILVNDGYFVHFFAPSSLPTLGKHVVFVLDVSGSMIGTKIQQLQDAMRSILSELRPGDYFNIVAFSYGAKVHDIKSADPEAPPPLPHNTYYGEEQPAQLVPPAAASPENIKKANVIIDRLDAAGGTNIAYALDVAIALVNKGINWKPVKGKTDVVKQNPQDTYYESYPHGGQSTNEEKNTTEDEIESTTASAVSTPSADTGSIKVEPIIIFLTDGDPTVGETDPKRIINRVTEKNYGPNKSSIFSLAFGEQADRTFLRKLSLRNEGFMRHIYESADAALQLRDFYRQVSSPLLADVTFTYPKEQVAEADVTKSKFRTFFRGSETVVAGRVADDALALTPEVNAFCAVSDGEGRRRFKVTPKMPVAGSRDGYLPLERLWAFLTIRQLLDQRDADADTVPLPDQPKPEKRALELALKYGFVTPLTSLVVVKPNATNAVDPESVDKTDTSSPAFASAIQPFPAYLSHLSGQMGVQASSDTASRIDFRVETTDAVFFEDYNDQDFSKESLVLPTALGTPVGGYPVTPSQLQFLPAQPSPSEPNTWLSDYPWASSLVHSDNTLRLVVNGTEVSMKLADNGVDPPKAEASCSQAIDGGRGVCVYLTRCQAARKITKEDYQTSYCLVKDGYAGVCCPKPGKKDEVSS